MVGGISGRGNVLVGKYPVGEASVEEVSSREIVRSGKCLSEKCPVGDLSSGKCQLGNCPVGKLPYNRLKQHKVSPTYGNERNFFIVYKLDIWSRVLNTDFRLKYCLFKAIKITKNADPDKH